MKNLDYLFINGNVAAKSVSLLKENEYQVLASSKSGFFKKLIDYGYKNLEYSSIDALINEAYLDLKKYISDITEQNEHIMKYFFFRFDVSNVLVLLKGRLVNQNGKLNEIGNFSKENLINILDLQNNGAITDEMDFFEVVRKNFDNKNSFNLSNDILRASYDYLYNYVICSYVALEKAFNIEVTLKNVLTYFRSKRLSFSQNEYLDSIIPYGLIDYSTWSKYYDLTVSEVIDGLKIVFNSDFAVALEALKNINELDNFNNALLNIKNNLLKDIAKEEEILGSLISYVNQKELEFKNIKSVYFDSSNLSKIILWGTYGRYSINFK